MIFNGTCLGTCTSSGAGVTLWPLHHVSPSKQSAESTSGSRVSVPISGIGIGHRDVNSSRQVTTPSRRMKEVMLASTNDICRNGGHLSDCTPVTYCVKLLSQNVLTLQCDEARYHDSHDLFNQSCPSNNIYITLYFFNELGLKRLILGCCSTH